MKSYTHFTPEERMCLYLLLKINKTVTEIAKELGRNKSTISREIKRNSDENGNYNPFMAHQKYCERRTKCKRRYRIRPNTKLFDFIVKRLKKYWSPQIIAEKWNQKNPDDKISFTAIYIAIRKGLFKGITPKTHLRRRGKRKYGRRSKFCTIHPEHTIHERPPQAENREECGHLEGDTIRGATGKGCLVTLVDRKSRKLFACKSNDMSAKSVYEAVIKACEGIRPKSITFDNGSEFAWFKKMEAELNTTIYFADTHSPWQRGSNENINDCLRFFFPKGFDFRKLNDDDLKKVIDIINSRPRFCLNLLSPNQVFRCT